MITTSVARAIILAAMVALAIASAVAQQTQSQQPPSKPQRTAKPDIPPDAENAAQALLASPRHGEWVEIALRAQPAAESASDVKIKTWVVYPERKGPAPVVIVIHEIFGLTDWVRAVADQLAADGFIAVAPDLLSGKGPGAGGTESFEGDAVREAIRKLSDDEVTQRLNAVRDHALGLPSASGKSAAIGFCWGGSASFTYATRQPKLNAAVVYYGSAPSEDNKPDKDALAKINCPVLGHYGGDDAHVTSTVQPTAAAMQELKKTFTHHIHENAGHGFLRQQSGREGANLNAAKQSWSETIAFLKKNLE